MQQIEERSNLPENFNYEDKERIESLQQRYLHLQNKLETIRNNPNQPTINTEQIIENTDQLIKRVREIEERIRANTIQPISEYERLIPDCQV